MSRFWVAVLVSIFSLELAMGVSLAVCFYNRPALSMGLLLWMLNLNNFSAVASTYAGLNHSFPLISKYLVGVLTMPFSTSCSMLSSLHYFQSIRFLLLPTMTLLLNCTRPVKYLKRDNSLFPMMTTYRPGPWLLALLYERHTHTAWLTAARNVLRYNSYCLVPTLSNPSTRGSFDISIYLLAFLILKVSVPTFFTSIFLTLY